MSKQLQKQLETENNLNKENKNLGQILDRDYTGQKIDQKMDAIHNYTQKLDKFVSKEDERTKVLIDKVKKWDQDL